MNTYTKNKLKKDLEFSYNNGLIEVLISCGYGAGWSTWNNNYSINLAVDKRIIDYYKKNKERKLGKNEIEKFLSSIGYEGVYCGGWNKMAIETVPPNCKFRIDEYDGAESLIIYENDEIWEL